MKDFGSAPLFSIIVPAYNSADFINRCIQSVLSQSFFDFELLIIDDGSKDKTLEQCRKYALEDSRVKISHQENGGHTSARNMGLKASKGKYIIFLDSDDCLAPEILKQCSRKIQEVEPDMIIYKMQDSSGNIMFSSDILAGDYQIRDRSNGIWDKMLMSKSGSFVFPKSLSAKCFKREIIYQNQINIPTEVLVGEDGAAFVGAMMTGESLSVIDSVGYICFYRYNSVSRSSDKEAFRRLSLLLDYYRKMFKDKNINISSQFDR